MAILQIIRSEGNAMPPLKPLPYDPESVARSKAFQQEERANAIREMGIPRDLVDLWDVFGQEKVELWVKLLRTVRAE